MVPTILVTGGAGYIGSLTSQMLVQQGYRVVILDKLVYQGSFQPSWATFVQADYADRAALTKVFQEHRVTAVMHFAGYIEVGESVAQPLKFYANNVAQTITLLETMKAHGVRNIIFSSSCAVYGKPQVVPIPEDHGVHPLSPYGRTKLIIEQMLGDVHRTQDLHYVTLRYFNAAGAVPEQGIGERHIPETHLIPLVIQAAQQQRPVDIFGADYGTRDGTCVRDYLHILDIARAHLLALQHLEAGKPSDTFNLGTGHGYTVKEVVECVERVSNTPLKVLLKDRRPGDSPQLIADAAKAHSILGWKPQFSDLEYIVRSAFVFAQQG